MFLSILPDEITYVTSAEKIIFAEHSNLFMKKKTNLPRRFKKKRFCIGNIFITKDTSNC